VGGVGVDLGCGCDRWDVLGLIWLVGRTDRSCCGLPGLWKEQVGGVGVDRACGLNRWVLLGLMWLVDGTGGRSFD
jgi:hypothetical protein